MNDYKSEAIHHQNVMRLRLKTRSSSLKQSVPKCMNQPERPCSRLSTTLFKLASSTMFKPVNNTVQAGQLNHVQACQQHCSTWPAQPCSSLSTTLFKLVSSTMFKSVNNTVQAGQLNHVQTSQHAKQAVHFYLYLASETRQKYRLLKILCWNMHILSIFLSISKI